MVSPPADPTAGWRAALGETSRVWAGEAARHRLEAHAWVTLSGAADVERNLAVAYGEPEAGTSAVARLRGELEEEGVPSMLALAGAELAMAGSLLDAGWVCVHAQPVMVAELPLRPPRPGAGTAGAGVEGAPRARALTPDEAVVEDLRALVASAFDVEPETARLSVPGVARLRAEPSWRCYGVVVEGTLAAGGLCCRSGEYACVWSMATRPEHRRRGLAAGVLRVMLEEATADGARRAALLASELGVGLYASEGFSTVEHWQTWSRPGWVLV